MTKITSESTNVIGETSINAPTEPISIIGAKSDECGSAGPLAIEIPKLPPRRDTCQNSTLSPIEIDQFNTAVMNCEIDAIKYEIDDLNAKLQSMIELRNEICPHLYTTKEYDDDFHKPRTYKSCDTCKMECYNGYWR
jgi:hypothetical protein